MARWSVTSFTSLTTILMARMRLPTGSCVNTALLPRTTPTPSPSLKNGWSVGLNIRQERSRPTTKEEEKEKEKEHTIWQWKSTSLQDSYTPPVSEMPAVAESPALALHRPNPSDDDQVVQVEGREQQMMMDDGFQTRADMQLQLANSDEWVWGGDNWGCTWEELMQSPTPATADDHQGSSSLELDKEDKPQAKKPRVNAPPVPDSTFHPSPITCLTPPPPPPPMDMEGNDMGIRPFETTNHTVASAAGVLPRLPHLSTANEAWSMDKLTITDHTAADAGLLMQSPVWKVPLFGYQAIDPPISLLGF